MSAKNRFRKRKWKESFYCYLDSVVCESRFYISVYNRLLRLPKLILWYLNRKNVFVSDSIIFHKFRKFN